MKSTIARSSDPGGKRWCSLKIQNINNCPTTSSSVAAMRIFTIPGAAAALLISIVNAAESGGCGTSLSRGFKAGGDSNKIKIKSSGVSREYNIYVPHNYKIKVAAPLILSFHGGLQTADDQEKLSQLSNPKFNPDGIAVYPQGIDECWQGVPGCEGTDDIQFTMDIINDIKTSYCVDTTRIYATGKSDGGGLLGILACNSTSAGTIAAFAPVSGAFYAQNSSMDCDPQRSPVPIIEFHGSEDDTMPYYGGDRRDDTLPSIPDWLSLWASRNGDDKSNKTSSLYKHKVKISSWDHMVIGYLIDGLGHVWPSTVANADSSYGTYFNATSIIMDFFANNTLSSASASSTAPSVTLSSGTATATATASETPKSSATSLALMTLEHSLFLLGFSLFLSFQILSVGLHYRSRSD